MVESEVDFVLVEQRAVLRDHFALLDEGVQAVGARTTEGVCAGDVYSAALRGECEIRLVRVDEAICGFAATTASTSLTGEKTLLVWMLYVRPGTPSVFEEAAAELDFMALEQGCSSIEFSTTRLAFKRRMGQFGYVPDTIIFRKEVT